MDIFAGASDQNVRVTNRARRVAVPGEGHSSLKLTIKRRVCLSENQLVSLKHRCRCQVEVSATQHKDSRLGPYLDQLEIMRKVIRSVSLVLSHTVGRNIVDFVFAEVVVPPERKHSLGVLVKDVDYLGGLACDGRFELDNIF